MRFALNDIQPRPYWKEPLLGKLLFNNNARRKTNTDAVI
jgi:hypothetical protein